jgi:hypothetical protein
MEHLAQPERHWAVVRVRRHQIAHVMPPPPAYVGCGNGVPERFVVDLDISEKFSRVG